MDKAKALKISSGITKAVLLGLSNTTVAVFKVAGKSGSGYILDAVYGEDFPVKNKSIFATTIKRLERQNFVSWSALENGKTVLKLEENGQKRILRYTLETLKLKTTTKWDGKYRVIIFDIPENKKVARETLRRKLKELEFYKLQKSVFVSPYECKDEIDFLKQTYGIEPYVHYLLAIEIPRIDPKRWFK